MVLSAPLRRARRDDRNGYITWYIRSPESKDKAVFSKTAITSSSGLRLMRTIPFWKAYSEADAPMEAWAQWTQAQLGRVVLELGRVLPKPIQAHLLEPSSTDFEDQSKPYV